VHAAPCSHARAHTHTHTHAHTHTLAHTHAHAHAHTHTHMHAHTHTDTDTHTLTRIASHLSRARDLQVACIIGPSGAGKTSLFNALCGVGKTDPGAVISLDGHPLTRDLARVEVAFVAQVTERACLPHLLAHQYPQKSIPSLACRSLANSWASRLQLSHAECVLRVCGRACTWACVL
jgi:ABC-type transport system involved in cytochrome bd biosynthesis fused ATPase/permease subunit